MIGTHPLAPAAGTLMACAAVALTVLTAPASVSAAAVAWVMLGVAAGYSISGSP